jgi:hypothetical protein
MRAPTRDERGALAFRVDGPQQFARRGPDELGGLLRRERRIDDASTGSFGSGAMPERDDAARSSNVAPMSSRPFAPSGCEPTG